MMWKLRKLLVRSNLMGRQELSSAALIALMTGTTLATIVTATVITTSCIMRITVTSETT